MSQAQPIFTFEMDEILREAVETPELKDLKKRKKWEAVAKLLPGLTPEQCQARWTLVKTLPGLEYKSIALLPNPQGVQTKRRSSGIKASLRSDQVVGSAGSGLRRAGSPRVSASGGRATTAHQQNDPVKTYGFFPNESPMLTSDWHYSSANHPATHNTTPTNPNIALANRNVAQLSHSSAEEIVAQESSDSSSDVTIMIHVCDEHRGVQKDFHCSRHLLLQEMAYFKDHLSAHNPLEEVDISVHCDVHVFEWLMQYLHNTQNPTLEVDNVVSILISSDFLQMHRLVATCLLFVKHNISQIVRLPIDLGCINDSLLRRLSKLFEVNELEAIRDKKDKLQSKLYILHLEHLLDTEGNHLFCCDSCDRLFTAEQREWELCPKGKVFIDFHGNALAEHTPRPNWDLHQYLLSLRSQGLNWREIYWRMWGLSRSLHCATCEELFVVAEMGGCLYHPKQPVFKNEENLAVYPCCQQQAVRFDTSVGPKRGCKSRNHLVAASLGGVCSHSVTEAEKEVWRLVQQLGPLVWASREAGTEAGVHIEFGDNQARARTRGSQEVGIEQEKEDEDGSGSIVVQYMSEEEGSLMGSDEDAASDTFSSDSDDYTASLAQRRVMRSREEAQRGTGLGAFPQLQRRRRKKVVGGGGNSMVPPKKRRSWLVEEQRHTDMVRMEELMRSLTAQRVDTEENKKRGGTRKPLFLSQSKIAHYTQKVAIAGGTSQVYRGAQKKANLT